MARPDGSAPSPLDAQAPEAVDAAMQIEWDVHQQAMGTGDGEIFTATTVERGDRPVRSP